MDMVVVQDELLEISVFFVIIDGEDKSEVGDVLDWFSDGKEIDINGDEVDCGIQVDI